MLPAPTEAAIRRKAGGPPDRSGEPDALRGELVRFLEGMDLGPSKHWSGDGSLLQSGLLDSTALFQLVAWIEERIGRPIDPGSLDVVAEWDTVSGILAFIERVRGGGAPSGQASPGPD